MNDRGRLSRRFFAVTLLGGMLGALLPGGADAKLAPANALPATVGDFAAPAGPQAKDGPREPLLRLAEADCSSAAAEAAAETGGQVLSVSSREQGGRTVCVVTVLVPGDDGERPRKRTVTVPQ